MKDLEIILKPQPDTEFWSSLLETEITVMNYLGQITVTIISNLVFCALLGKESYQDPDGTWHLPFFMDSFGGGVICVSRNMPEHRLEWTDLNIDHKWWYRSYLEEYSLRQLYKNVWCPYGEIRNCVMILIRFKDPTQLDRITLQTSSRSLQDPWIVPDGTSPTVFEEDQIFSLDFMGVKIYGICLDPKIKGWKELSEVMTRQPDTPSEFSPLSGLSLSRELMIDLEAYPKSIPEISLLCQTVLIIL